MEAWRNAPRSSLDSFTNPSNASSSRKICVDILHKVFDIFHSAGLALSLNKLSMV